MGLDDRINIELKSLAAGGLISLPLIGAYLNHLTAYGIPYVGSTGMSYMPAFVTFAAVPLAGALIIGGIGYFLAKTFLGYKPKEKKT